MKYNEVFSTVRLQELNILYAGWSECAPGHRYKIRRDFLLIHYIYNGKGSAIIEGTVYHLKRGDCFIYLPGQEEDYFADKNKPWSYAWLAISGKAVSDICDILQIGKGNQVLIGSFRPDLKSLFFQLIDVIQTGKTGNEIKQCALCFSILSELSFPGTGRMIKKKTNNFEKIKKKEEIKKVISYIRENLDKRLSVAILCSLTGFNRVYFSKVFKRETGESALEYILHERMKRAKLLLLTTDHKITAIGTMTGYSDYFGFARCFKKFCGETPSDYRKRMTVRQLRQ